MSKGKDHIVRLIMLVSSFVLSLTVMMPHHHHESGAPCINIVDQYNHDEGNSHQHGCDCTGHDLVFNSNMLQDSWEESGTPLPVFLHAVSNCIYPPLITILSTDLLYEKPVYTESLHSTWISTAASLRAPPVV